MDERHGSFGRALAWMLSLSVLLAWLPVLGPVVAGFVGGRKARAAGTALVVGGIVAALWWGLLSWASRQGVTIKQDTITLGPLALLGPVTAAVLLGGALMGARGRGARSAGVLLLALGLLWFVPRAREVWDGVRQFLPEKAPVYDEAKNKTCPENLTALFNGAKFYADLNGTLPAAKTWMTDIKPFVPKDEYLHCPEVSKGHNAKFGYAMNAALGGKKLADVKDADKTILFYDSTDLKENASDALKSLPTPGRHTGRNNVVYASGRVEAVAP